MCGILCLICDNNDTHLINLYNNCFDQIRKRGPDYCNKSAGQSKQGVQINFAASVLWLQGSQITKQPIDNENSTFVYNGDIFNLSEIEKQEQGDTVLFLNKLENGTLNEIVETLEQIHGPYSFIWLSKSENLLVFARDPFGRRSLLIANQIKDGNVFLCSTALRAVDQSFLELPAIGVFVFNINSKILLLYPWSKRHKNFADQVDKLENFLNVRIQVVENNFAINFIPENVSEPTCSDLALFHKIQNLTTDEAFKVLLRDNNWFKNVTELENILENALKCRIKSQPKYCQICIKKFTQNCNHCKVGILFSGGLDCTILALLADKYIDPEAPIDLLNVAFSKLNSYETPDRETGLESFEELKTLRPKRQWNFVAIDISVEELSKTRTSVIADLIYPLDTILDDDLGSALWFASRGSNEFYKSTCRVILVGMGADELFGGYTRHRAALKKFGIQGLHQSLLEDWQNISRRNLARDDRVVSDHGRQLRTPYLDENVVDFVLKLNVWQRTYPSDELPQGLGEKILLRSLAYKLGLRKASTFKKRALQFGSRIADKKQRGHEVSTGLS